MVLHGCERVFVPLLAPEGIDHVQLGVGDCEDWLVEHARLDHQPTTQVDPDSRVTLVSPLLIRRWPDGDCVAAEQQQRGCGCHATLQELYAQLRARVGGRFV